MRNLVRKALVMSGVLFSGLFVIFVFNQTVQFVAAAERVSPVLGTVVLWTLLALYACGVVMLFWNFMLLPKPLRAPAKEDGPQFEAFLHRLRARLRGNDVLRGQPLDTRDDVDAALDLLGERSDEMTRTAALQAFFVTALSQNGNLDALAVITIHARLVYDIARLYWQRPTFRDLLFLYGNVAAAAIVARQLDDWDMTEYVTPIINASMGSVVSAVPGATAAGNALVHAVLTGSANAYMTLRVGIIVKQYCGAVTMPERPDVRQTAFVEAAKMFPGIVAQGTKKVGQVIGAAVMKGSKGAVEAVGRGVRVAAEKTATTAGGTVRGVGRALDSVRTTVREMAAGRAKGRLR